MLLPIDTTGRSLEILLILEEVTFVSNLFFNWVINELKLHHKFDGNAVLESTTFIFSYLLFDKCCSKHN